MGVIAMSIWTVRGVNTNCADRNDVTGNGSPIGVPAEVIEPPAPDVRDAGAIRHEVQDASVGTPPRLVIKPGALGHRSPRTTGGRYHVNRRRRGVERDRVRER